MASMQVIFYLENGKAPALEWLLKQPHKVQDKFDFCIEMLELEGGSLKRPYAAPLRDKVYELRVRWLKVNYRLLFFPWDYRRRARTWLYERRVCGRRRYRESHLASQPFSEKCFIAHLSRMTAGRESELAMKAKATRNTASARDILYRRVYTGNPERIEDLRQTRREMALGNKIRHLREEAGLTQHQLARQIGTQPSAISRIEDADYDRHSVSLLQRVAEALDMRLVIDFKRKPHARRRLSL